MRRIEGVLIVLALISAALKLYSIEGGAILTVISFLSLSLLYFWGGFIILNETPLNKIFKASTYSNLGWRKILWSILSGIVLAYSVLGILFPILSWYGASIILINSFIMILPVFSISLIYALRGSKLNKSILLRSATVVIISIFEWVILV
jgi:hypothetical protein